MTPLSKTERLDKNSYANHAKTTHNQFRREIAKCLVKTEARLRMGGSTAQHNTTVRYNGVNHTLKSV